MKKLLLCAFVAGLIAGCATSYQPIVDTRSADMRYYNRDLQECRQEATRVDPGASVGLGAGGGAILGGVLGAIFGNGRDAGNLAAAGAVIGGVGGQVVSEQAQRDIIRRCMIGRGYRVLN